MGRGEWNLRHRHLWSVGAETWGKEGGGGVLTYEVGYPSQIGHFSPRGDISSLFSFPHKLS